VNPNSAGTIEYSRWLQDRLVEAADKALADLQPATLAWGSGIANFAMNRREFTDKGVILGVNPRGSVDRTVPVLTVDGVDGKPRVVLFGYACHGTTNPPSHMGVSPDYPGFARGVVEQHFPGATAMFIAGCGGDANPYPRLKLEDAVTNGDELGKEVCRVAESGTLKAIHGPLACATVTAQLPLERPDRAALEKIAKGPNGMKKADAQAMLAALDRGEALPAAHAAPVAASGSPGIATRSWATCRRGGSLAKGATKPAGSTSAAVGSHPRCRRRWLTPPRRRQRWRDGNKSCFSHFPRPI
jgi:hypothetical protein